MDIPEPLTAIYDPSAKDLTAEDLSAKCCTVYEYLNRVTTLESLSLLEQVTQEQAKNQSWHVHRMGRITGTMFHRVFTSRDSSRANLIADVMRYEEKELNVAAVKWGRDMEDRARARYVEIQQDLHENFSLRPSGLVVKHGALHLAASPDGIFTCKCCGTGVLEVKCPHKYKAGLKDANKDSQFCLDNNRVFKKKSQILFSNSTQNVCM